MQHFRIFPSGAAFTGTLLAATTAGSASAGINVDESFDGFNRLIGQQENGVGAVYINGQFTGSGALIGDRYFLTAAHVIVDAPQIELRFGNATADGSNSLNYTARDWYIPTDYNVFQGFGRGDVALVRLEDDVSDALKRYDIYEGDPVGQDFKHVGYGTTGTGLFGADFIYDGVRRGGYNHYDSAGGRGRQIISHDFDFNPGEAAPFESFYEQYYSGEFGNEDDAILPGRDSLQDFRLPLEWQTSFGDSGSPTFIDGEIAGVVSFGQGFSQFTTIASEVRAAAYKDFYDNIQDTLGESTVLSDADTRSQLGAFRGSPGNPVSIFNFNPELIPDGDDPDLPDPTPDPDPEADPNTMQVSTAQLASIQQRQAGLLQLYFDEEIGPELGYSELMQLAGGNPSQSITQTAAVLNLDEDASEADVEQALRAYIDESLPSFAESLVEGYGNEEMLVEPSTFGYLKRFDASQYEDRGDGILVHRNAPDDFVVPEGAGDPDFGVPPAGDMNLSMNTDVADADAFARAIAIAEGLTPDGDPRQGQQFLQIANLLGDFTQDGLVTRDDITGFSEVTGLSVADLNARVDAFRVVPEPTTLAMLAGLGVLASRRRRLQSR
ncbi:trypsin-like serine protease [Phycisphaera mikurensis]|uniref:Peptidase S1 domain-containing protein n=1 Tax=Phycisphaera mikurensis (strain NBRC 102666 / KCTC 22515 / FYK2301M01) TaxID=1142394 RepID=I0IDJ4_PHYMF|nr:trypsin-like serine protease [Phycisphaera mikurensis]MBB6441152.1 hypothetical protein [Phycisphaera mikurensis]BAM03332.1 hypothetical protein PSMK_11730 [Phycisphaera mikurensis NBRC 102666]